MRRALLLAAACAIAGAQIAPPRLGWIPDGARLRPVYGTARTAALEDAPDIGRDLANIVISPLQNYALATAADNGDVLLIIPGNAAAPVARTSASPDRIVISPGGSATALWFASTGHVQIVSGLPAAPAVQEIDASFLGAIRAMAVSDDGSWVAAVSDQGVYAIGSQTIPLPVDPDVAALTFFAGSSDLALATGSGIVSLTGFASNPQISTLYASATPISAVGIAISPDNSSLAVADAGGVVYLVSLVGGVESALAILDCDCAPEGVFPLGTAAFRFTSPANGPVKILDLETSRVAVIPAGPAAEPVTAAASTGNPPLPTPVISMSFPGTITATLNQQGSMTISIPAAYPADISGTATLAFASSVGGDDQMIQFGSGGRSVNFTIPAGSTAASFAGKSSVAVLTGTVAGTITITATINSADAAPATGTATITTTRIAPQIDSVTLSQSGGGLTVVVTGYTSSREVQSGVFSFTAGGKATIQQSSITVPLASAFASWFGNSSSNAFGSQFTLTVPFTVQGSAGNVVRVAVDLSNSVGVSSVVSSK